MATVADIIRAAAARLRDVGIERGGQEARLLLAHALGRDPAALLRHPDQHVDTAAFGPLLSRRLQREPLALIVGRQDFWTLQLATAPVTLIPRADSETLIEAALAAFPARDASRVLDLGTGTGCLLLAALSEFPRAFGVGIDLVPAAVRLAADNASTNALAARAAFFCGHWDCALQGEFDLILCNPPYITHAEIAGLMPEVARHEPATALDGGADGMDAYRMVTAAMARLLARDGVAIVELGIGQAAEVIALARSSGLQPAGLRRDLGGIERALILRRAVP